MIYIEDREFEREILESHSMITVPFQVTINRDGTEEITVYSFCENIAKEFEERFSGKMLTEEARAFLREKLTPVMNEIGYVLNTADDVCDLLVLDDLSKMKTEYVTGNAQHIDMDKQSLLKITKSGIDIDDMIMGQNYDEEPVFAVTDENGAFLSYATTNDTDEFDDAVEITVETEYSNRRKGYGTDCVAAISRYFLERGKIIAYVCSDDNTPSISMARRLGFELERVIMSVVCYSEEDLPSIENIQLL